MMNGKLETSNLVNRELPVLWKVRRKDQRSFAFNALRDNNTAQRQFKGEWRKFASVITASRVSVT
jgi:hypothetical protein